MVSGESASIEAVEELPYTEITDTAAGGAGALTTTKFKNVGVQLNVEASLTDSNDIFLAVETEQNAAAGQSETEIPIVDTRKASTSLLLKDGQVVVFGGLRRQEKTKEVDQIPILGDLPVVGFLFRSTNIIIRNSELIVFLSPHIYKGEPVPDDIMSKYREITDKPVLKYPEDGMSRENRNRIEQRDDEYETAIEKLRQNVTEYQQVAKDLKQFHQFESDILKQNTENKQLQVQIDKNKRGKDELVTYKTPLEELINNQSIDIDQLRQKVNGYSQSERDAAKKILLEKIKILQQRKNRETAKELLSSLALLDEILSHEINETITTSEKVMAKEDKAVDRKL